MKSKSKVSASELGNPDQELTALIAILPMHEAKVAKLTPSTDKVMAARVKREAGEVETRIAELKKSGAKLIAPEAQQPE